MIRQGVFLAIVILFAASTVSAQEASLTFVENKNQWSHDVHFGALVPGGQMRIGAGYFAYQLIDKSQLEANHLKTHEHLKPDASNAIKGHLVRASFVGANLSATYSPLGRTDSYSNFYLGKDPKRWASHAYGYTGILYNDIYPGIGLKIYSVGENLKYDYIVSPWSDPSQIVVRYEGAENLLLDNGNLYIKTTLGDLIEKRPVAWQIIDGKKVHVDVSYSLNVDLVTFCFPDGYDPCYELIVDPLLIFSTYSGSTADNWGSTATPGEHGNLYSAGVTSQSLGGAFPATPGAFQRLSGGDWDIGILKYDSLGKKLLYATHLGGSGPESPHSLVMNSNEELIVLGTTSSSDFPTSAGAFLREFQGGEADNHVVSYFAGCDIFISRFNRDGSVMLASTYLGGSENDGLNIQGSELVKNYGDQLRGDVITDNEGNVYISSVTASEDFPMVNGFHDEYNGGLTDALVVKMTPDLSQIVWSNYLGGDETDAAYSIKLDKDNNLFVAGGTNSEDFPYSDFHFPKNAYDSTWNGDVDGWMVKLQSDGKRILNATYTGRDLFDQVYFLDLNTAEEVYVYGQTTSTSFPITAGIYNKPRSGQFLQKFRNDLSAIEFSTVFGSGRVTPDISPTAFLVNDCGIIYMSGWAGGVLNRFVGGWNTNSLGLQVSDDAFQRNTSGNDFYFIVLYDDAKKFLYGTFLGGNQSFTHVDGGTSRFDKRGTVYHAVCAGCRAGTGFPKSDFPTTPGAWSRTNASPNCNNAAFKFDLSSLRAIIRTNSPKRNFPGQNHVCMPDKLMFENKSIGGEIHEWTMGDGTFYSRRDTAAFVHEYKKEGTFLVKLKIIDERTCKGIDSTSTYVTVDRRVGKGPADDDICFGEQYRLNASGGSSYSWTNDDGSFTSTLGQPVVSPKDTTSYFVTITEATGCVTKDTVKLNVIPGINPTFEFNRMSSCSGKLLLGVKSSTDSLEADDIVYFDFGDGTTSDEEETTHEFENEGVFKVRLVTNRVDCVVEQIEEIPMFRIVVPNVITPGVDDDINDFLTVQLGDTPGVTPSQYGIKVSLTAYNRWGRILFHDDDYQYNWPNEELASGVYYYDVKVEGYSECKSWVHIIN
ncbi:MAG TPA: gliding motility-associated C-terminal domain-containing protein [Chryseosolibacter sp.]